MRRLFVDTFYIEKLTEPNGLIVDPFLGSGTTALASMRLHRRFVGAEIDARTLEKARERIAEECDVTPLRFGY